MTLALALILVGLTGTVPALLVRRRFVIVLVSGLSMLPTLQPGDRVLVRRVAGTALRTGDLAVMRPPGLEDPRIKRWVIKRVAAVPGDPEPTFLPAWARPPNGIVPVGQVALLGDNAEASIDSRRLGFFSAEQVLGVVVRTVGAGVSDVTCK